MRFQLFSRVWRAFGTLRWRLTSISVLFLVLLLTTLGAFEYFSLRNDVIGSRIASVTSDVAAAASVVPKNQTHSGCVAGAARAQLFANAIETVSGQKVSVLVYDQPGNMTARAPGTPSSLIDLSVIQSVFTNGAASDPTVVRVGNDDLLVAALPVGKTDGVPCGVVEVSTSMQPINDVLRSAGIRFIAGSVVALGFALAIELVLVSRALRPLRRLRDVARHVARGNLRVRSELKPGHDEVGELTRSLDEMAARIEKLFAAQWEAERQVHRFIADASHELRTPITTLKGYLDVLKMGAGRDPQVQAEAMATMSREADRMRSLVADLLTLARVDANEPMHPERINLNEAVWAVLEEGVAGMPETITRNLAEQTVEVFADRNALYAILRNLLVNACKYAPGVPQHWTTSLAHDPSGAERCVIAVRDEGPGIPTEDLPHIFERFFRGEKARSQEEGGTGLGLSIVQQLARVQGGDVRIESAVGKGTTVEVWLPRAQLEVEG